MLSPLAFGVWGKKWNKTGPPLSIVLGEEWVFDEDFSQAWKRDN
jgi:hypothetical protein